MTLSADDTNNADFKFIYLCNLRCLRMKNK